MPKQFKRQTLFDIFDRRFHPVLTFTHDGTAFYPRGVDIGDIEGINKLALFGAA